MATSDLDDSRKLIARIASFLHEQRLDPHPTNYAFAFRLLCEADGSLAQAVSALTDGGVKLTHRDIAASTGESFAPGKTEAIREGLAAKTQMQIEDLEDMMRAMRSETEGFGRDLEASAAAMRKSATASPNEVMRLTSAMIERVRSAEARLEIATHEASELREKLEEARDNARRDPLTGLPNRRAFEEAYDAWRGAPACVAMCDIDRFKSVNDRFGHAVGDRVLKGIADALTSSCPGHHVARYGGEEFAVLFMNCVSEEAQRTLNAARLLVASSQYWVRESGEAMGEVTFSAGLTIALPGEPRSEVVQRADALLYRAKGAGRNCLRIG